MVSGEAHWDQIHATKTHDSVSWFQNPPRESLRLVLKHSTPSASVVDVGAGQSLLVDQLLDVGYVDIAILDVSTVALDAVKRRLKTGESRVAMFAADVTTWSPARTFHVWHDRAVFHFLTSAESQRAYVDSVARVVEPNGVIIIGAFGPDGPTSCSGLPVQRHSVESLRAMFAPIAELVDSSVETHVTPSGAEQDFVWTVFRRAKQSHANASHSIPITDH